MFPPLSDRKMHIPIMTEVEIEVPLTEKELEKVTLPEVTSPRESALK